MTSARDQALLELYRRVKAGAPAPKPGTFSALNAEERREYYRIARRRSRAREQKSVEAGAIEPTAANVRDALADAALMILATDGPGADQVRTVLAAVFQKRPGVPMTVEMRARRGKLRPKLVRLPK